MNTQETNVILEDINGKFDHIVEIVGALNEKIDKKADKSDLDEIKADIKIMKAALTETSHQVNDHEQRITTLELQT